MIDNEPTELLQGVKNGDHVAVESIYRQYYSVVYAFVRLQINDLGAAEEIVDDVFMVVFTSANSFKGQSSFKTWVLGIAKNLSRNWLRKIGREPSNQFDSTEDQLADLIDPDWPALEQLEREELNVIIQFCMTRLPLSQRETLFYVYFEDLTLEQVAQTLGCPSGTIKSRLFHAKTKMAECVNRRIAYGVA